MFQSPCLEFYRPQYTAQQSACWTLLLQHVHGPVCGPRSPADDPTVSLLVTLLPICFLLEGAGGGRYLSSFSPPLSDPLGAFPTKPSPEQGHLLSLTEGGSAEEDALAQGWEKLAAGCS